MLPAAICTKTELPADPPLMAYAGAPLVLSASMRTHGLHIVQRDWVKSCCQSCWLGRGHGGSFQAELSDHDSSGKTQLWGALHPCAWIQESLWTNWSVFMFGKYELLLWCSRVIPELYSRLVKGLETCYKAAVNTCSSNAQCSIFEIEVLL